MKTRIIQWAILVVGILLISALSIGNVNGVSTHSSYDAGPNGYLALFNVLRSEGIPMERARRSLGLEIGDANVWLVTSTTLDAYTGNLQYDQNEIKTLRAFVKHGGIVEMFTAPAEEHKFLVKTLQFTPKFFPVNNYTNAALDKNPGRLIDVYDALAGHGAVLVDERIHGYDANRSLWSALPPAVHTAGWIVLMALLIALVGANVRIAPPIVRDPPPDRDSSTYIVSMASLLRRARAPHTVRKERS